MRYAFLTLLCCLAFLQALPSSAAAATELGSVDLSAFCRSTGWDGAVLEGPVQAPNAAYGWRCARGASRGSVDVQAACRAQYAAPAATASPQNVDDAYSWRCYAASIQAPTISYTAFDKHTESLVPWQGEKVVVLVQPGKERDESVMNRLVATLDRAYQYYATTAGREPATQNSLNGRVEIAEVTSTCGAGCGYLGATGVEIATPYFESLYDSIAKDNLYSQIPFYELGRNFWFWGPQLAFKVPADDPVTTGYAVWMRFESMAAAQVNGSPFNGTPFAVFQSEVADLARQYEANPSLTFAGTLAQNKSPGKYGGTDFWASLMMQLAQRHGGQPFRTRFLQKASRLPAATTTAGAVSNWVQAASFAACADLSAVFYTRWGFPRPDGTVTQRPASGAVPEPAGGTCQPLRDNPDIPPPPAAAPSADTAPPGAGSASPGAGNPHPTSSLPRRCHRVRPVAAAQKRRLQHARRKLAGADTRRATARYRRLVHRRKAQYLAARRPRLVCK